MFEGARRFHINFDSYNKDEKLSTILSDVNLKYISANFCFDILNRRRDFCIETDEYLLHFCNLF